MAPPTVAEALARHDPGPEDLAVLKAHVKAVLADARLKRPRPGQRIDHDNPDMGHPDQRGFRPGDTGQPPPPDAVFRHGHAFDPHPGAD